MGKNISHSSGYETVFGDEAQTNSGMCMLTNGTPENVILKLILASEDEDWYSASSTVIDYVD